MIDQLFEHLGQLTRPIIFFDTETTGPDPREDRIVELGFIQLKPDGRTREWQSYIDPCVPIPKEATFGNPDKGYEGHGITDLKVQGKRTFRDLAPDLLRGFHDCDYGGYNIARYDLPLLAAEFKRAGHEWSYADARVLDGFRLWQLGQGRTLTDAVEYFLKRKHQGAHSALDDVRGSIDVVVEQLRQFAQLPKDLQQLHDKQFPRDPNAIDADGKIIWKDGVAVMNFGKKWKGVPLDRMTQRDLKWIVFDATGINDSTKQVCRDALAGKFPNARN